jgi:lysophospholipase
MMKSVRTHALFALSLLAIAPAWAIPEENYREEYARTVLPFLRSGEPIAFGGADGTILSGVAFHHPQARGAVVIVSGRTESWVQYGEVFYDLYQMGYSSFGYDHRGQGLSPRLGTQNPQIGHIENFEDYAADLDRFVKEVVTPRTAPGEKLFLLAHSMGGAVAADYLANFASPFASAVLSAPMLQINTDPYPEAVASSITGGAVLLGKGAEYALGKTDRDPNAPFETNEVTGSEERYWMMMESVRLYPETALGGPSSRWVCESIAATHRIRAEMKRIEIPMLVLQAGHDTIVKPSGQDIGCRRAKNCTRLHFAEAKHDLLMESDPIRNRVLLLVDQLFSGAW